MPTKKHRHTITSNEKVEEGQAAEDYEQRRYASAKRLADRFLQLEGFDYAALREVSAQRAPRRP